MSARIFATDVVNGLHGNPRDVTLADVVAWLQERAATYLQLVEEARVAREWVLVEHDWERAPALHLVQDAGIQHIEPDPVVYAYLDTGPQPMWRVEVLGVELPYTYLSGESARAAGDAEARSQGWVLVNPPGGAP